MKIVAHRGNSPKFKESTPSAYIYALGMDIHGVECDVHLCKSGELVVHHDAELSRTVAQSEQRRGRVRDMTLDELKSVNIGTDDVPEVMLTLPELLHMVRDAGKVLYLEVKAPHVFDDAVERRVIDDLREAEMDGGTHVEIISFSHRVMRRASKLAPQIPRWYLRKATEERFNRRDRMFSSPTGRGVDIEVLRRHPELLRAAGQPTYCWTVNDESDISWAIAHDVDVVATDVPGRVLRMRDNATSVD